MDDQTGLGTPRHGWRPYLGSLFGKRVTFGPLVFRYSARDTVPLISAPIRHTGLTVRLILVTMVNFRRLNREWTWVTRWLFVRRYQRVNEEKYRLFKKRAITDHLTDEEKFVFSVLHIL